MSPLPPIPLDILISYIETLAVFTAISAALTALAAEKAFYEDIVERGKAVVNHRLARDFIDGLAKRWQAEGGLTKGRQEWLDKANAILEKRDPYNVNA